MNEKIKMELFSRLKQMRILLIDNDELIRDCMSLFFEDEGCKIVTCMTAEEGMEYLRQQSFDIVICDCILPGMDGYQFFRRLQEIQPHVIKILLTAYGSNYFVSKAKLMGICDCISKPLSSQKIEETLARSIEKYEKETKKLNQKFKMVS